MSVKISSLEVEFPGRFTRKFDSGTTVITINEEQARSIHEQLGPVLAFFDQQKPQNALTAPAVPLSRSA